VPEPTSQPAVSEAFSPTDQRKRLRILLAYAIAGLSILVAFVGFRAAEYAGEASRLDARAVREDSRGKQLLAQRDARIAHDVSVAAQVRALRVEAESLADASRRRARVGDVPGATILRLRSLQAAAAADLLVLRGFIVAYPDEAASGVTYDVHFARASSRDTEEIDLLDAERFSRRADELDDTSLNLLAVSALLVLAIACLTIARVLGRRSGEVVGVLGLVCAVSGIASFLLVGP
jgi:hypothetical protein